MFGKIPFEISKSWNRQKYFWNKMPGLRRIKNFIVIIVVIVQFFIATFGAFFSVKLYKAHGGCSYQETHCLNIFQTFWSCISYFMFFTTGCSHALARCKNKQTYAAGHYVLVVLSVCFCIIWILSAIYYLEKVKPEETNHARMFAHVLLGLFCAELLVLMAIAIYDKGLLTQDSTEDEQYFLGGGHGRNYEPLQED